jgi:hypothetical protein
MAKKSDRRVIDKVFVLLGIVITVVLLVVGGLSWHAYKFATNTVHDQLASQKIFFPPLGSAALASPEIGPYLNKYAGQQLLTGPQAEAYADHFIAVHLSEVANGQTYSQVSTASMADPTNATLQGEKATLFQGETLRGLLLGDGYAYWTFGQIAKDASIAIFTAAGVLALLVLLGERHLSRHK